MPERGLTHAALRLRMLFAAYLDKAPGDLSTEDIRGVARKFCGFCNTELKVKNKVEVRDVQKWLKDGKSIYADYQDRLVKFFKKRWEFFDDAMLQHDIEDFGGNLHRKIAAHIRTIVIQLSAPVRVFDEADREFLSGVYELYRHSFANDGKVNIDLLVIKPDPAIPTTLTMEVIVEAIRHDKQHEHFVGPFCQYGHSLLGLPVFVDITGDDHKHARVRRYEFSDEGLKRTHENLIKVGIVSGNSVQLGYPVATKCLISKLSDDPARYVDYLGIANRYPTSKLYKHYVEAISNDIRHDPPERSEQDDHLLLARPLRPKVRPRSTFPPLPEDPSDPLKRRWENR